MMLLPTGVGDRPFYRIPLITLGLMAANILVFVLTWAFSSMADNHAAVLRELIETSLTEHPFVAVPARLDSFLTPQERSAIALSRDAPSSALPPEQRIRAQQEVDALVDDYVVTLQRLPAFRFGFVPLRWSWLTLVTAMFMHGGLLHLVGNMLFLWVSGSYIEDVYGKSLYAAGYLLSGVAATLGQWAAAPQSGIPIIGASGAIAGVMGIMLVRLTTARIRFLFFPIAFLPMVRVPITLPAMVVLPFWALEQLWYAGTARADAGVAFWAHVAGFGFGVVFALAVALLHVEDRWLQRSAAADEGMRALDNAAVARQRGDFGKAHERIRDAGAADPADVDMWFERYELALAERDAPEAAKAFARLLDALAAGGRSSDALSLIDDGRWNEMPDTTARMYFAVAAFLDRQRDAVRALSLYGKVLEMTSGDALAQRAAARVAELKKNAAGV